MKRVCCEDRRLCWAVGSTVTSSWVLEAPELWIVPLCDPGPLRGGCPKRLLSYAGLFAPTSLILCRGCSRFLRLVFKPLLLFPGCPPVSLRTPFFFFPLSFVLILPGFFIWHPPVFLGFAVSALVCKATITKSEPFFFLPLLISTPINHTGLM